MGCPARRRLRRTAAAHLVAGLAASGPLHAQPIEADRPGLLYTASVLPRGGVQLELGAPQLAWTRGAGGDSTLLNFPSVLRVGLGAAAELQVGHTLLNRLSPTAGVGPRETGAGDLSLALKLARPAAGSRPGLVVVASASLPTGAEPFTSGDPVYALQAQAGWSLGSASLAALVGYAHSPAEGRDVTSGALAVSAGFALGEAWATYLEAGYFPGFESVADTASAGTGITRILGERFQLDAFLSRGLNQATPDWTAGAGFSVRF